MEYNVLFASGRIMCFYTKALAETYAIAYNGTLMDKLVEEPLPITVALV